MNISNIASGWFNHIKDKLGMLDKETKDLAEARLKICDICPRRVKNKCGVCGCQLEAKAKDPNSTCPIKRW